MIDIRGMTISEIISAAGGVVRLARGVGVSHSAVIDWRRAGRIPANRVPAVSRITGVPRHVLRPDLWDAAEDGTRVAS